MLANTLYIREHFCLTCKKICRRDSAPGIVRYCSGRKRRVAVRKHGFLRQCAERGGEGLFSASMVFKQGESPACRKSLKTRFSAQTCAGRANTSYRKKENFAPPFFGTAAFLCFPEKRTRKGLCWKAEGANLFQNKIKAGGVRHEKGRRMEHGPGGTEEKGIGGKAAEAGLHGGV
ncbi:hypothetical protein [Ruthenibacterium lactatiformans]|uniref:hypothetical protein n=1 Tax=Ruthenibacterium lactatiformans TaxID=1550024 RepID=UPI003995E117